MAIGTLFGVNPESSGLYGIATGTGSNPTVINQTYFEWFIFTTSAGTPATPTGGSWDFNSNTGTAPAGWFSFISGVPLNSLWFSVAFVDSRNPTVINWATPGLISSQSVYATAYADVFTGNGSTVAWTLTQDPVVVNNTDVSINGVTQVPTTDYTVSGTTLTTTTAAPLNAVILVKYRQALPLSYYGAASNVQFTPVGALTATNVQAAIAEVVSDFALSSGSSTVGFLQAGTGAVATTVQAKLRQTVSVKDFGAVGDGVANDTAAIQAAEDYATSLSVPVDLYFPAGVYAITASIQKKTNVNWNGSGQIERLNYATATGAAFSLVVANGVNDWTIQGVDFKNVTRTRELAVPLTSSVAVGSSNTCLDVFNCSRWAIRECTIRQFAYGILYRECQDFQITNNWLYADTGKTVAQIIDGTYTNFSAYAGTGGIVNLYKPSGPNLPSSQYLISGNYVEIPGLDIGIDVLSQTYDKMPSTVTNNIIKGCLTGFQLYRGSFADPGTAPTYNSASMLIGNRVYASWGAGIYIRAVIGVQVIGNYLERCGAGGADGNTSSGAIVIRVNPFTVPGFVTSAVTNDHAILVQGNRIVDYGRNDIACDPAVLIENDNVIFEGNEVNRSEEEFTSQRGIGINVGNGKKLRNCTIINNKISGYWTTGISVADTLRNASFSDFVTIFGNDIIGNYSIGIAIDWCSFNVDVSANFISGVFSTTAIRLKNAPFSKIKNNTINGGVVGITVSSGNLSSDTARFLSAGTITALNRRGGSLMVNENNIFNATTPFLVTETDTNDVLLYGRCMEFENNYTDNSLVYTEFSGGTPGTNAAKIWTKHDFALNSAVAVGQTPGKVCITSGQYGSAATTTGDTTNGSPTITSVGSLDGYGPGIFIAATGFSGVVRILSINTTTSTITVSANASSNNIGVTLTPSTPTFAAMPNLV
jgi:hypothetical protein